MDTFNYNEKPKILIVDDHPMTVIGYELLLNESMGKDSINIDKAFNCDQALLKMKYSNRKIFNIILLDISLPTSENHAVVNGLELGLQLRLEFPQTKIIIHTGLNDPLLISNILKSLNPEGFLIKSDIEPKVLLNAVYSVLENKKYFSKQVNKLISPNDFRDLDVDRFDLKILYYLSIGEKMKNLPQHIPLSMSTIERRKRNLKLLFGINSESDRKLLSIAREKGLLI